MCYVCVWKVISAVWMTLSVTVSAVGSSLCPLTEELNVPLVALTGLLCVCGVCAVLAHGCLSPGPETLRGDYGVLVIAP